MRITNFIIAKLGCIFAPIFNYLDKWIENENFLTVDSIILQIILTIVLFIALLLFSLAFVVPLVGFIYAIVYLEAKLTQWIYRSKSEVWTSQETYEEMLEWLGEQGSASWNIIDNSFVTFVKQNEGETTPDNGTECRHIHFLTKKLKAWFLLRWGSQIV